MNRTTAELHHFRLKVTIRGAVQGVGFRPFVFRLATEMQMPGWVSNSTEGVFIEVEGPKDLLDRFLLRLQKEAPPRAFIQSSSFEIRKSDSGGKKTAFVLPDIAVCPDCLTDVFDPTNRRYLYPFTNCTNCGPRFSIIEALPYDRRSTSMKKFEMCLKCRAEYENPADRRFHAQPNACPQCGPQLQLWDNDGKRIAEQNNALLQGAQAIREGKIVAVKGLGGFHLITDARNEEAVRRLRERKHREEKPFALIYPSLDRVREECLVSELEERLLLSPESPIVLLQRKRQSIGDPQSQMENLQSSICFSIAPHNPYLGVMLPYAPLHYLLLRELGFPLVATSGNISDEPICIDEVEVLDRLKNIADLFLVHDRPIVRHVDDSVVCVMLGREMVLRRARGYAPLPISIVSDSTPSVVAVGAHLKNTIALTSGNNIFISQHIGDLETQESLDAFHRVIADFKTLFESTPSIVACDLHPDYLSSKFARTLASEVLEVQHHYAHIASCMAENQLDGEVLGVSWDGTGFGLDGTIWGGEFLITTAASFERIATFRPFRLPGGEKAIKEPRRTAAGLLYELNKGELLDDMSLEPMKSFTKPDLAVIQQMLKKGVNSPVTTSVGRLFDAVASLIGLRQHVNFEGQAAMELEFLTASQKTKEHYSFVVDQSNQFSSPHLINWEPMIFEILSELGKANTWPTIAVKFHNTLAECILEVAQQVGRQRVVLSGGCFQNRYLTERTVQRLQEKGFRPYWHQRIPPNDGGISLGQAYAVARLKRKKSA
jgi:hydrogenase maturation protein HypF